MATRQISREAWINEGRDRFGDTSRWAFVCPNCGRRQTIAEMKAAGMGENAWAFSCIGRWLGDSRKVEFGQKDRGGGCNYAGGGLFRLNPVIVMDGEKEHAVFEWAA